MTDWDQLNAMGQLSQMRQREAVAKAQAARDAKHADEQAQRDAALATQQAEVIRLLREQKEREERERASVEREAARLAALPKCPDCCSTVEVGARRCPKCRAELISWDYSHSRYRWRLICRAPESQPMLQSRCQSLLREVGKLRSECMAALAPINNDWVRRAEASVRDFGASFGRYNSEARHVLLSLLPKALNKQPLLTSDEEHQFRKMRTEAEVRYSHRDASSLMSAQQASTLESKATDLERTAKQDASKAGEATVGCLTIVAFVIGAVFLLVAVLDELINRKGKSLVADNPSGLVVGVALLTTGFFGWRFGSLKKGRLLRSSAKAARDAEAARAEQASHEAAVRVADVARAAAKNAEFAKIGQRQSEISKSRLKTLNDSGLPENLRAIDALVQEASGAMSQCRGPLGELRSVLLVLADTLDFAASVGAATQALCGSDSAAVRKWASELPEEVTCRFSRSRVLEGKKAGVAETMQAVNDTRAALMAVAL